MTNIEKIKQARSDLDDVLTTLTVELSALSHEHLVQAIDRMSYLQADAIRQATEVADENFARAQKLSEQVQENVRHIERLAGERGEVFTAVVDALDGLLFAYCDPGNQGSDHDDKISAARAALALTKGEAV